MPVDRAAAILARFRVAQRALISQFRELPPGAAEHQPVERRLERGADRLSRRDGERVGRRRAGRRDAARPAGAARIHGAFQPRGGPPAEERFPCRRPPSSGAKRRSSGSASAVTSSRGPSRRSRRSVARAIRLRSLSARFRCSSWQITDGGACRAAHRTGGADPVTHVAERAGRHVSPLAIGSPLRILPAACGTSKQLLESFYCCGNVR